MPAELYTYTGSKLALEIKNQFGDTGGVQITDAMILQWINNGQRSIAATNPILERTFQTNLLAGQTAYDIDTLMSSARLMSFSSVLAGDAKLKFVTWEKFLEGDWSDIATAGSPQIFTEYGGKLTIYPAATESVVNGLTIYFIAWPADLVSIGDPLTIPDRFYNALSKYVFAQALELDENFDAAAAQLEAHASALSVEAGRDNLNPTDAYHTATYVEP